MTCKALVIGGAGFIGSHLVERLLNENYGVTVLDDFSAGKHENLKAVKNSVQIVEASVENLELVRHFVSLSDIIFHLATQCLVKGLEDPQLMHEVNDVGTYNICLAAKEYNKKIVYVSSSEAYGRQTTFPIKEDAIMNPISIYGLTKLIGEHYVSFFHTIYGVPAVIIRPFNTFGPRQREDNYAGVITAFMQRVMNRLPPIIHGDGKQRRDFTYISDIVDGILLLSKLENGEVVNIGSGKEVSVLHMARLIYNLWNVDTLEEPEEPKLEFVKPRPNDIYRLLADISTAKNYGYSPKVSFEEGITRYVDWLKKKEAETIILKVRLEKFY